MTEASPLPRRLRELIESAAMAVLLAIGLKYFLVEAFEIPTPSMQPTLMGSAAAGVHDRILVDKAAYLLREPKRWDVAIFRYPLNRSQDYVKRIVGVGGDRLRIIGGDVYRVEDRGARPPRYRILRKPNGLQERLWRLIYSSADADAKAGFPAETADRGLWKWSGRALEAEDTGQGARIAFRPPAGLTNRYWHGYPKGIRERIRAAREQLPIAETPHYVGDLDLRLEVRPSAGSRLVAFEEVCRRPTGPERVHRLELDLQAGEARLRFFERRGRRLLPGARSEKTAIPRQAAALAVRFSYRDGRLEASVAGRGLAPIDPPDPRPAPLSSVSLHFETEGGRTRFEKIELRRDIYYTTDGVEGRTIEVPPGHFWMLGDNTQASADSRLWKSLALWVAADGRLVPAGTPGARRIVGNYRPIPVDQPPDPDENPVVVRRKHRIVFTDLQGEEHVLIGGEEDLRRAIEAAPPTPQPFVPRKYVLGRAFLTFWPANPFGVFRIGLIR